MHDETDDTIPHAVRERLARSAVDVEDVDVALGDTILRDAARRERVSARIDAARDLPPVPAALRPHYRLRVAGGEPLELDRPVQIGRKPRAPRVPSPADPRYVTVESPQGGISGTHLELREQGTVVVATDMRTLNGSEVRIPGSPVRVLRGGESIAVTPGTFIDLGEGVVVEVLPPGRGEAREAAR